MGASRLVGQLGQVVLPGESRADISTHGFYKRGTTATFNIRIVNLDVGSYLCMPPEKALAKAEKEKKDLFLQACLERKRTFTPMVKSVEGIPGAEALAVPRRLDTLLSYKLKREYSEMCGFVRARMLLAIVRSKSLLIRVPRDKRVCIWQEPEMKDGAVMSVLAPWHG